MAKIVKFEQKDLDDKKKSSIFVEGDDEPIGGALAFTDFDKPSPILTGEEAERFIQMMEENEKKAKERKEPTLEELKDKLSFEKMFLEWDKETIRKREEKIKDLENKIKELEKN